MVGHPFIPQDLILDDFVPVSRAQSTIVCIFLSISFLYASFVWFISGRFAKLSKIERLIMCWWAFTGLTQIILEGYFVFSPEFYKDSSYFADAWKACSLGDWRYAGRESSVVTIHAFYAFHLGPACLLAVYAIAKRKSYSDILQISISLGHIWGVTAYFSTSFLQGNNFVSSPSHYYLCIVLGNSFWICIPALIIIRSWKKLCAAVLVASHLKPRPRRRTKLGDGVVVREVHISH